MKSLTRDRLLAFFIGWSLVFGVAAFLLHSLALCILTIISTLLLGIIIHDIFQTKHALLKNFPLVGRLRWVFEDERSKIQQYFIENDLNGTPYNREERSDVYQKAHKAINTTPFGTQKNVYGEGYEYLKHSMYPIDVKDVKEPRLLIGSTLCSQPYDASVFNISAMSYGALSEAAIRALNGGAKLGGFYHNTGEGGLSPYHIANGGDVCFQIGTGYFGCGKTVDGKRVFDEIAFKETINHPCVKMIEIKLSQGAKPGHGGILPAKKNTTEIAKIRGVEPYTEVVSPPYHSAFHNEVELLFFIEHVRELSGGRPIGIKLCLGDEQEIIDLIKAMSKWDKYPDFITVDGGEGGTGAAPLVFTNSVGMPLLDALKLVNKTLIDVGLREDIKIIASGKASNSFDIIKLIAMGADAVNAARAFMLSMGCIQARECNQNTCPVGIATQDKMLIKGLNPEEKQVRVYNYHSSVIHEVKEVLGAMGCRSIYHVTADKIMHRQADGTLKSYKQLYLENKFGNIEN